VSWRRLRPGPTRSAGIAVAGGLAGPPGRLAADLDQFAAALELTKAAIANRTRWRGSPTGADNPSQRVLHCGDTPLD